MPTPTVRAMLSASLLAAPALALAQSGPSVALAAEDEEPPPPPVVLRNVPPRFSWELALTVSYGMLSHYPNAPPYAGFGLRGGWGKHYGPHRVGVGLGFSFEGPVTVQWTNNLEPQFLWDVITPRGFYAGVSAGPSFVLAASLGESIRHDLEFDVAPMLAARIGFSQPWSLIARRFFVAIEPKVRYVDGAFSVLGAIVIGSGRGY